MAPAHAQSFLGQLAGKGPTTSTVEPSVAAKSPRVPSKTSFSTDQSDLWRTAGENGWGVELVQQADVIFATMFVYGPDGKPTWCIATLEPVGGLVWSGGMIVTTGSYFGAAWNQAAVTARTVGTMTVSIPFVNSGSMTYSVDGVVVNTAIQRTLLRYDNYNGSYDVLLKATNTGCNNPADNGDYVLSATLNVLQNVTAMTVQRINVDSGYVCSFAEAYSQLGRMGALSSGIACSDGITGSANFIELTNRIEIMSGRLPGTDSTGCSFTGRFTALIP